MPVRQYYQNSAVGPITKDSETYATLLTLTFTPDANTRYAIFISCSAGPTESSGTGPHLRLRENSITRAELVCDGTSNNFLHGFGMLYMHTEGATPVSRSFVLQGRSTDTGFDIQFRDMQIIALRLEDGNDGDQYKTHDSLETETTTTYSDQVTLTFTPDNAGDYLVIGYAETGNNSTLSYGQCRLNINSTGQKALDRLYIISNDYWPYLKMSKKTFAASSQTMTMQIAASGGGGVITHGRRFRVLALRLGKFLSSKFIDNSSADTETTSTFKEYLNLNFAANKANYLILTCHDHGDDRDPSTSHVQSRIQKDNVDWLGEDFKDKWNRGGSKRCNNTAFKIEELAEQTYDYDIEFKMIGTGTAYCDDAAIVALELDQLSDSPPEGARLLREFANDFGRLKYVAVREFPR